MTDLERLQNVVDDVGDTLDMVLRWFEYAEEYELSRGTVSPSAELKADGARLRAVADALVPARIRDEATGRRLYLAPDDARQRERQLVTALDAADAAATAVVRDLQEADERERVERESSSSRTSTGDRAESAARGDHRVPADAWSGNGEGNRRGGRHGSELRRHPRS